MFPMLADKNCRKLEVFDRKSAGSYSLIYHYFDIVKKIKKYVQMLSSLLISTDMVSELSSLTFKLRLKKPH